jgi:phosphoglucomutase
MKVSPFAGKPAKPAMLVNVPRLVTAYYTEAPDPSVPEQRVSFGTSGHRGSAFEKAFNEWHILAISQAICLYREQKKIDGPLFLGMDTHALSVPALASALEVLAANGVEVMIAEGDEYTPTPAVSHAILAYNRGRKTGLADGIVITPSHNPPHDGGFKYNPPNGGPAESDVTAWIEAKANEFLESGLLNLKRIPFEKALPSPTTHRHDYRNAYISDLANVIDMDAVRGAKISLGVDPTFRFMTVDWDGQIRMDPSSPYAMQQSLIDLKDRFVIAFACDTDLAGEKVRTILTHAPGNGASIGGIKVIAESGWFAARPSGTEDIYKIYAESFRGADHLRRILEEAQTTVNKALAAAPQRSGLAGKTNSEEKP